MVSDGWLIWFDGMICICSYNGHLYLNPFHVMVSFNTPWKHQKVLQGEWGVYFQFLRQEEIFKGLVIWDHYYLSLCYVYCGVERNPSYLHFFHD